MVIRSKALLRHVLANQHKLPPKLQNLLLQQTRLCSHNAPLAQPDGRSIVHEQPKLVIDTATIGHVRPDPQQCDHSPVVGRQFSSNELRVRLAAPDQLQTKPDADALAFGKFFTDHMLKVYWHKSLGGWQKPEITPMENLVLHPAAKVLHYAIELFEGMKAYRGVDGRIRVFRPKMNMNRMNLTAARSGLPTFENEQMIECINRLISIDQEWVPHKNAASLYIRPTMIGIDPTLGVASSDSALLYAILSPVGDYFKEGASTGAISLLADPRYTRAWPGGVGDRKMGSNYAPTINVQKVAAEKGLAQVLWLFGEDHQVTEVGTMNIFIFFVNSKGERELRTPPLNGLILPGITRDSVLQLAGQWGQFRVTEEIFTMPDVAQLVREDRLLEMFGTGTACVVSPIERIQYMGEDIAIPTMQHAEPLFLKIKSELAAIQFGHKEHPWAVVID